MPVTAPARDLGLRRRYPVGAEFQPRGGTHFRVWAPEIRDVSVVIEGDAGTNMHRLARGERGYFGGLVPGAGPGTRYRYALDDRGAFPDPASRFQPDGPHGVSMVIDPSTFAWRDAAWTGITRPALVVYEIHVGTFTPGGTWRTAEAELPALADLGVTVLEIMPIADFPGRFGWGYDGVDLFAPTRLYGTPDDLRSFVDAAHGLGLGVVLDVVYNHFGPDGCWLDRFSPYYFADRETEWGRSINFDGPHSAEVREFYLANAAYWIEEFHFDGLRLDATQSIHDASGTHILREIGDTVRAAANGRSTWIVVENEPQKSEIVRSHAEGGLGLDAIWNDDFHHTAVVALTGRREAYYTDYLGSPQEFISAFKHGFLYQGQWYSWQKNGRGTPATGLPPDAFVTFLENHDQVANSWTGARLHALASPGRLRAMTALLLLGPSTPMLFQGQEFASSAPFLYFADHERDLAALVRAGRAEFLTQFTSMAHAERDYPIPDPSDPETFRRSTLDPTERERHASAVALHASLIQLRASHGAFRGQGRCGFDGAVLAPQAFVLRYFSQGPCGALDDRLLLVNLGMQVELIHLPEPLLAPPSGLDWSMIWSSEEPLYGGGGTPDVRLDNGWRLPAESALLFGPEPARPR